MKCLILAAGYATRLYPLTENFPKPLLEVKGKTILDWLIDDIDTLNVIDEYIVISNHKFYSHFENWAKTKSVSITVLDDGTTSNENRLGAVIDIKFAVDTLKLSDDLLILAGDNVLDFSLKKFIGYSLNKNSSCVMRYFESDINRLKKSGVAQIGDNDLLLSLEEKPENPKSNWCTPPFYFYKKEDISRLDSAVSDGCGTDAPGSLVGWMCKNSVVYSMEMPGKRYDIGSLESYNSIKESYSGIIE
ncbi:MAG: NTP transferase domain-containing protein [Clostridiales bacterium]|nr:NTP transferase domain-containing protein [Clostridiales bacterium]